MYRLRFLKIIFKALLFPAEEPVTEDSVIFFRAWPGDVDISRLYTHSYLSFIALARWKWILQKWHLRKALKYRWAPVTSVEIIRYRFPIRLFQKFSVRTRLIYWTEKMIYFEQRFQTREGTAAIAFVKGVIKGGRGDPKPWEVFNIPETPPEMPEVVRQWEKMSPCFQEKQGLPLKSKEVL